jgi:hypothetical protein
VPLLQPGEHDFIFQPRAADLQDLRVGPDPLPSAAERVFRRGKGLSTLAILATATSPCPSAKAGKTSLKRAAPRLRCDLPPRSGRPE